MGLRYRKSINLGGGFRINLSKSGVGYSWGVKGYRVTKTANGRTRRTASIPGTGISYVYETGRNTRNASGHRGTPAGNQYVPPVDNNHYDTQNIENNVANELVSEGLEEMLASASRALKLNDLSTIGLWVTLILGIGFPVLFLFSFAFLILKIYVKTKGTIVLDYSIDDDQQYLVDERIKPMIQVTGCQKVWRITQTSKVIDRKYSAGASSSVKQTTCKTSTKAPFPFKANLNVATFKSGKEILLFLPDKLFIIQGSKIGALNYNDISSKSHTTRFVEERPVPRDSRIVDRTWKYVNKSGGPDRRFKDNRQLPVCLYGELELTSSSGLNTVIMYSNPDIRIDMSKQGVSNTF